MLLRSNFHHSFSALCLIKLNSGSTGNHHKRKVSHGKSSAQPQNPWRAHGLSIENQNSLEELTLPDKVTEVYGQATDKKYLNTFTPQIFLG